MMATKYQLVFKAALMAALGGCSFTAPPGATPEQPAKSWSASQKPALPVSQLERAKIDQEITRIVENPRPVSLAELIDFALKTNPLTRSSWLQAQAAYGTLQMERSNYYPQITVGGELQRARQALNTAQGGTFNRTTKGPFTNLSWLLFDFGAREARVAERLQALVGANYAHNSAMQQVVLEVQRSFYQYIALRSLEKSQLTSVKDAELNLDAAA